MKRIISMSRIVESREVATGPREIIASAEAEFDEGKSDLVIDLDSRAIITDAHGHETQVAEEWLPHRETVHEHMDLAETTAAAREIFERWSGKVRGAIPGLLTR